MTKTFDEICSKILGEMITSNPGLSSTPQQPQAGQANNADNQATNNQANTNQANTNQANPANPAQQYQKSPSAQQQPAANPQPSKEDEELVKLLQMKMQDEKIKQQLMQILKHPQTNATNKPA